MFFNLKNTTFICTLIILTTYYRLLEASPVELVPNINISTNGRVGKLRIISMKNHHSSSDRRHEHPKRENSEKDIVFPDQLDIIVNAPIPRINGVPRCARKDETFCENFEEYPKNQLKNILKRRINANNDGLYEFFGKDEEAPIIVNRHGGLEESLNFLCPSVERTIFPKIGKNKNNKWRFIINQGSEDGYIQGVRVETCQRKNAPCDLIGEIPLGYVTSCKQKFIYRRLLSVNDVGAPTPDSFKLPSACCCSYKRDMDFLARFASAGKETKKP